MDIMKRQSLLAQQQRTARNAQRKLEEERRRLEEERRKLEEEERKRILAANPKPPLYKKSNKTATRTNGIAIRPGTNRRQVTQKKARRNRRNFNKY
jgi:hypothetical protein